MIHLPSLSLTSSSDTPILYQMPFLMALPWQTHSYPSKSLTKLHVPQGAFTEHSFLSILRRTRARPSPCSHCTLDFPLYNTSANIIAIICTSSGLIPKLFKMNSNPAAEEALWDQDSALFIPVSPASRMKKAFSKVSLNDQMKGGLNLCKQNWPVLLSPGAPLTWACSVWGGQMKPLPTTLLRGVHISSGTHLVPQCLYGIFK